MKTNAAVALCCAFIGLPLFAAGPPAQERGDAPAPGRALAVSVAREVMEKAQYCTFVTIAQDGEPQARVMDPFPPEGDLTIWLATKATTRKVEQIEANPRVTLLYFDPKDLAYVEVLGRAELVRDPAEKAKHWKEAWKRFYMDENRGYDYLLIRVKPSRLEIVDTARGLSSDPNTWRPVVLDLR